MELEDMRKSLSSIAIVVFVPPHDAPKLAEHVREAVEGAGLKAFVRAEGYAFMQSEEVGRLGLPHLRLALIEGRISMWVRDPYKLGAGPGLVAEELYDGIVRGARAAASVIRAYCSEKGAEAIINVP